jgi:hypothetical protein
VSRSRNGRFSEPGNHWHQCQEGTWQLGDRSGVSFKDLPATEPMRGRGHVYILAFDHGMTKVGRAARPLRRVREHIYAGWVWDRKVLSGWVSDPLADEEAIEAQLLQWCSTHSERRGDSEWFRGLDFNAAVAAARAMCATLTAKEAA